MKDNASPPENQQYDTPEQVRENFRRWWQAMEVSDAMLMAGLRDRVGPDGDLKEAYQQWQSQRRKIKLNAYKRAAKRYAETLAKQTHAPPATSSAQDRVENG